MSRKKREFWESAALNTATQRFYYDQLVELAISMFKWVNLPDSVDPRFLELTLFADGQCVFFRDDELGFLALQNAMAGNLNVYRIPINRRAYAANGYNKNLTENDSVVIFNNFMHTNSRMDAALTARKLYNIDRAIEVNANAQKTPILILCDESQRLTMLNLYKQFEGNEPFIFGDKMLNANTITSVNTQAPYVADKLYELKRNIWNEALTRLGIFNVDQNKKERLITDEVEKNQADTVANRWARLAVRQQACEQINRMFSLNISCVYRDDYIETRQEGEPVE